MAAVSTTGTNSREIGGPTGSTDTHLFPLPLVPFEQYMLADDRADYPMAFTVIAELSGKIRPAALHAAIKEAITHHPLLHCRVEHLPGRGLCWVPLPPTRFNIDWGTSFDPVECAAGERINLWSEPGLRIWVRRSDERVTLTLQFHHACCDGVGAAVFIGDLLAFYAVRTAGPGDVPVPRRAFDPDVLRRRHPTAPQNIHGGKRRRFSWQTCYKAVRLLARRPAPLARPADADRRRLAAAPLRFPPIVSQPIPRREYQGLREAARRKGVTCNDLFLNAMFHTIREWNERHGIVHSRRWLRIGVPVNLRCHEHDGMPAANVVSYMFLTRRTSECDDADNLLDSIRRQTTAIRQNRFGMHFMKALETLSRIPQGLPMLLRANSCYATVILGNMGDVTRAFRFTFPRTRGRCVVGNLVLERLLGSAPVRPGTHASVCVGTYAGALFINLHADPHVYSAEDAHHLLALFIEQLTRQSSDGFRKRSE